MGGVEFWGGGGAGFGGVDGVGFGGVDGVGFGEWTESDLGEWTESDLGEWTESNFLGGVESNFFGGVESNFLGGVESNFFGGVGLDFWGWVESNFEALAGSRESLRVWEQRNLRELLEQSVLAERENLPEEHPAVQRSKVHQQHLSLSPEAVPSATSAGTQKPTRGAMQTHRKRRSRGLASQFAVASWGGSWSVGCS